MEPIAPAPPPVRPTSRRRLWCLCAVLAVLLAPAAWVTVPYSLESQSIAWVEGRGGKVEFQTDVDWRAQFSGKVRTNVGVDLRNATFADVRKLQESLPETKIFLTAAQDK